MSHAPDLSLPATIRRSELTEVNECLTFALYALCNISHEDLEEYARKCATEIAPGSVKLPPRAHFRNESLRAILDYHLELVRGAKFDPRYFIVCVYPDATNALIVTLDDQSTLDDEDGDPKPDSLWVRQSESGVHVAGLSISNTDWLEVSDNYGVDGPRWSDSAAP